MIRALLLVALIPFMLTACGKTETQKTQERVEDGNAKISRMNAINQDVVKRFRIVLLANSIASTKAVDDLNSMSISTLSKSELMEAQSLTAEFVATAEVVLRIIDSDNVVYGGDRGTIERGRTNGRKVHEMINARLARI
jgi:hypothetical protein